METEITFNRLRRASPELREFTEYSVRVASGIRGIVPPTIHFFEIVAPSRDPSLIVTEERCIGFYKNGEIYSRLDLPPGRRVKNIFHEVSHAHTAQRTCKTLRFCSDEIEERTAWLFALEYCDGLPADASEKEAREFLGKVATRFSLESKMQPLLEAASLRKKMQPLVEQATQRVFSHEGNQETSQGIGIQVIARFKKQAKETEMSEAKIHIPEAVANILRPAEDDLRKERLELERLKTAEVAACEKHSLANRIGPMDYRATMALKGETPDLPDVGALRDEIALKEKVIEKKNDGLKVLQAKYDRAVQVAAANVEIHVQIVRKINAAIQALAAANEQEILFFDGLRRAGVSSIIFRSMAVRSVGSKSDPNSMANLHSRELRQFLPHYVSD